MKKEIKIDTKEIIEIFCELNNACFEEDKLSAISGVKRRLGAIINEGIERDIFGGEIAPFKINFDIVSKILENGKI